MVEIHASNAVESFARVRHVVGTFRLEECARSNAHMRFDLVMCIRNAHSSSSVFGINNTSRKFSTDL